MRSVPRPWNKFIVFRKMNSTFSRWQRKAKKSHLSIGIPIITIALLGTFGLSFLLESKYEIQAQKQRMVIISRITVGLSELLVFNLEPHGQGSRNNMTQERLEWLYNSMCQEVDELPRDKLHTPPLCTRTNTYIIMMLYTD